MVWELATTIIIIGSKVVTMLPCHPATDLEKYGANSIAQTPLKHWNAFLTSLLYLTFMQTHTLQNSPHYHQQVACQMA